MRPRTAKMLSAVFILTISMASCGHNDLFQSYEPDEDEDIANVFVNAYPAVPWSAIADKLEPKNNLTIEQARGLAAITTQAQLSQFLSTFGAGIAAGLPGITQSTTTTLAADGSKETTGTRTSSSGTLPTSAGVPASSITVSTAMPGLPTLPSGLGIDGSTLLTAGTALYQQAQILDNQITHALMPIGYQAHLITFQVNLQPKRRDLSYDTYVDIDLQPGSWDEAISGANSNGPPVSVYPLIVTDAFETTSMARSLEALRQASLQLSGMISGVGLSAGSAGGSDKRDSMISLDKNNLITVGRVNHHAVRVRLGAVNSGVSGMAMLPRSYNVSLVVLTRVGVTANQAKAISRLYALTNTSFVSALDGKIHMLGPARSRHKLAQRVATALNAYGFPLHIDRCKQAYPQESNEKMAGDSLSMLEVTAYLELLRAVDQGDYEKVTTCLNLPTSMNSSTQFTLRRLLAQLSGIQIDSKRATMLLTLRPVLDPLLPQENQLIEIIDDQNNSSAVLRGSQGISTDRLRAELQLEQGTALLPSSLTVRGDGKEIQIIFPSLKHLGLNPPSSATAPLKLYLRNFDNSEITKQYRVKVTSPPKENNEHNVDTKDKKENNGKEEDKKK
jgi:hypothetical protein